MAFVFDATPSSLTANSYIPLEGANDYFAARFGADSWDDLSDADKQALLAQATRRIDAEYFGGQKTVREQSLEWPRRFIYDKDGFPRDVDSIPKEVQYAACELAYYYMTQEDREVSVSALEDLEEIKIGPLGYKIKKGRKADELPEIVDRYLRGIGPSAWRGKRFPTHMGR